MVSRSAPLAVTLWRTFSRGRREQHTWRTFIDTFVRDPEIVRDKRKVAGFSLASFEDNRRSLPRVEQVYALVLDFDKGDTSIAQATKLYPETTSVIYTTFSHKPGHPKLRVILLFSRAVSAAEYERIWDGAAEKIKKAGHVLDESTRDASRFWYLPSHGLGAPYEWRELEGKPFNVSEALKKAGTAHSRLLPGRGAQRRRTTAPSPGSRRESTGESDESFFGRAFTIAGMAFDVTDNGALPVVCPWAASHTSGSDGDLSTVIMPLTTEATWGLFHCFHAHCVKRTTLDLLDVLPMAALDKARVEHGRGMVRVRIIDGWFQRLESIPEFPALDRFILKCRPREGPVFTMTLKIGSSMHVKYLDALPLPLLIGRRIDVSMEGKAVKSSRLVPEVIEPTTEAQRARGRALLAAHEPGASIDGLDFDFLFAVICRHPQLDEKLGPGVRRIRIRQTLAGKRFEVVRVDGSCVEY